MQCAELQDTPDQRPPPQSRPFGTSESGACPAVELGHIENIYQQRIDRLEVKLGELLDQNSKLKDELGKEQRWHDTHVKELQRDIEVEVQELKRRQDKVENVSPMLQRQIDVARSQLGSLSMSQSGYEKLKHTPSEGRSLADEVRLIMHEGMVQLKQETEASQRAEQVAKEALHHSIKDVAVLKGDIEQLKANSAGRLTETTNDAAHPSHLSRLQKEVEQVTIAAEINKAKADLYDEVAQHAQALEEEVKKLSSSDMERAVSQQELGRVSDFLKDCQHKLQLATVDKEYLKREVSSLETRLQEQQAQFAALDDSLTAEKSHSQELYRKLLAGEDNGCNKLQRHIDEEVARVREAARADIAALREESRHSLERETRLLRDMRDRSELEAERLAAELKDCRQDLDGAATRYRALQHKLDATSTSLAADLKIKTVDADRAHMTVAERDAHLQRVEAQHDLLCEKVKVLTDSLFAKEAHRNSRSRNLAHPIGWNSYEGGDGTLPSCSWDTDFSASDEHHPAFGNPMDAPRMQVSVLAAQCKALECELGTLRADRDALAHKFERSTRDLKRLEASNVTSNPNTFLMQELHDAEDAAQRSHQKAADAHSALQRQSDELHDCKVQLSAVQTDLRDVLQQRQLLEALKMSCVDHDKICTLNPSL